MAQRLILIDPTLKAGGGHNLDYARLVLNDARQAGFEVQAIAHREADRALDALIGAPVTPWFSLGLKDERPGARARLRTAFGPALYNALGRLRRALSPAPDADGALWARATPFAQDFAAWLAMARPKASDRLFLPTLSWAEGAKAAECLAAAPDLETHGVLLTVRFDPPANALGQSRLRAAARAAGGRAVWMTDTEALARAYAQILECPILVGRIPIDSDALDSALTRRSAPNPVRAVYLGESRREKGFHLLPEALAEIADQDIHVTVQILFNVAQGEAGIADAAAALRAMAGPKLTLIEGDLDSERFHAILGASHIALLPYQPRAYRLRSSGLLAQALYAKMAIVAPREPSWISETANNEVLFDCGSDDPKFIAHAIEAAASMVRQWSATGASPPKQRLSDLAPWTQTPW